MITADDARRNGAYRDTWFELQAGLVASSTRSTHVVMTGVGHHVNRDDPAVLVEQILTWLRHRSRLTDFSRNW